MDLPSLTCLDLCLSFTLLGGVGNYVEKGPRHPLHKERGGTLGEGDSCKGGKEGGPVILNSVIGTRRQVSRGNIYSYFP